MLLIVAVLVAIASAATSSLAQVAKTEIFLPPDASVVSVVGNGFKLELTQLAAAKKDWADVVDEAKKVELPSERTEEDDKVVSNEKLYEQTKATESDKDFGLVSRELLNWIKNRVTYLFNRIERYNDEISSLKALSGNRIVIEILLLNTLVNLDNIAKEKIFELRWLEPKLKKLLSPSKIDKGRYVTEVFTFVRDLISQATSIERSVTGTNNPGEKWIASVQALRRVQHEQRFSQELGSTIVTFQTNQFRSMTRSYVYDIFKTAKQLDDGLYYNSAKGLVPAYFPFAAQDAIANGAML